MSKSFTAIEYNLNSYVIFSDFFSENKVKGTRFYAQGLLDKNSGVKKPAITIPKNIIKDFISIMMSKGIKINVNQEIADQQFIDQEIMEEEISTVQNNEKSQIEEKIYDQVYENSYEELLEAFTISDKKRKIKNYQILKPSDIIFLTEIKSSNPEIYKLTIFEINSTRYSLYHCRCYFNEEKFDNVKIILSGDIAAAMRFSLYDNYNDSKAKFTYTDIITYKKLFTETIYHPEKDFNDILIEFIFRIAVGLDVPFSAKRSEDEIETCEISEINSVVKKRFQKSEDNFSNLIDWVFGYINIENLETDFLLSMKKQKLKCNKCKKEIKKEFKNRNFNDSTLIETNKNLKERLEKKSSNQKEIKFQVVKQYYDEKRKALLEKEKEILAKYTPEETETKIKAKEIERLKELIKKEQEKKLTTRETDRKIFLLKKYFAAELKE